MLINTLINVKHRQKKNNISRKKGNVNEGNLVQTRYDCHQCYFLKKLFHYNIKGNLTM